uniref:Uncharacterized protein n=1 Tax=Noctiluca scintillans TaxID=2966 RepID=A0A7S0ZSL7_NOCSC|mmetsp:Transcript_17276/g.46807  ORF Transcript_17276/g.46807 Transcript_17276/m.46807 type:complete len:143 (+) Transcript_17276:191-619(+)
MGGDDTYDEDCVPLVQERAKQRIVDSTSVSGKGHSRWWWPPTESVQQRTVEQFVEVLQTKSDQISDLLVDLPNQCARAMVSWRKSMNFSLPFLYRSLNTWGRLPPALAFQLFTPIRQRVRATSDRRTKCRYDRWFCAGRHFR